MATTNQTTLSAQQIKYIFHDVFYLDDDWTVSEACALKINNILKEKNAHSQELAINVVNECFRIDTKTHKPITEGFVIFDGTAYFEYEKDALDWLANSGFDFDSFEDVCNKVHSANLDDCYWTQWYEAMA